MDSNREEAEVFLEEVDEEGEEEWDDEDEDARNFNAWMQLYKGGRLHKKIREEGEDEGQSEEGRAESRSSSEAPVQRGSDRRASLPCPSTLSAMQLSRLYSSTQAPLTAKVLLHRSSSRQLLPSPQEVIAPPLERMPSLVRTVPEALAPERRWQFRRRKVMSLSDADCVCLICHNDLNGGTSGTRELQCTHTFHRECIEEWLWRKQSCPTCHVQLSMPKPNYWSSTRFKVP